MKYKMQTCVYTNIINYSVLKVPIAPTVLQGILQ